MYLGLKRVVRRECDGVSHGAAEAPASDGLWDVGSHVGVGIDIGVVALMRGLGTVLTRSHAYR